MKISNQLWRTINPTYEKIIQHPFITELAQGTLKKSRFLFFLSQDTYYLTHFSRACALLAGRSSSKTLEVFLNFAKDSVQAERDLHAHFLPASTHFDEIIPSPACLSYSQYIIAKASASNLEEATASILPCFWIYQKIGCHLASHTSPHNRYIRWIDTYAHPNMMALTKQTIHLLEDLAEHSSPKTRTLMNTSAHYSALFEWHFYNDAYNKLTFEKSISKQLLKNKTH